MKDSDFDAYVQRCKDGIISRTEGNEYTRNKLLKDLERQANEGRLNSFLFDQNSTKTFNQSLYDLRTLLNGDKGIDLSVMKKSADFLLKPTLKL